ncbi:MAG TPA: class I SAM-dependent methyltransferase [Gemmatimonadaceae bacterium]|nr:class I SAM-dependent methyltransferase [Gemmatimonadaceae bacterium]
MEFKDHFSGRAALYSKYRPTYPRKLFDWIGEITRNHGIVWDCATGSGQAAVGLANIFDRVIATDASEKQISMAVPHPSIEYRVATASASRLADSSVDAVTVAQAIHWLDHDSFYREARRVLKPDGAMLVWGYGDPVIDDPRLDKIVHDYNRGTIEEYWRPERDLILAGLRTIPFPFREIETPAFTMECQWTLPELAGYMRTWSATAAYAEKNGGDPVAAVEAELENKWGGGAHLVRWPLHLRAGYLLVSGNKTNRA